MRTVANFEAQMNPYSHTPSASTRTDWRVIHSLLPYLLEFKARVVAVIVLWRVLDEAHIATIAVHPDFRRRGIGRALLRTSMDAAYAEGARIYHLEVRAGNLAAQEMYADFGYEIVGRRPKYYQNNGEDALLLTLILPEET